MTNPACDFGDVPPAPVDRALELAENGYAVFPLNGKFPAIKGGHGHLDATKNPDQIRALWRDHPNAGVGIPTGPANGIVVIDPDFYKQDFDADRWAELSARFPASIVQQETPRGGLHIFFAYPSDGSKVTGGDGVLGRCIDRKAYGGYIRDYGARLSGVPLPIGPPEVYACKVKKKRSGSEPRQPSESNVQHVGHFNGDVSRYGQAALDRELEAIRQAPEGTRNAQLNTSAYSIGQLVGGGVHDRGQVERELTATAEAAGLDPGEIAATIRSGLDAGALEPRTTPEPKTRTPTTRAKNDTRLDLPSVLVPGPHIDNHGVAIDNGADVFARGVLGALPAGMLYRCAGVPGTLTGDPGEVAFVELTGDRLRLLIDEHVRLVRWVKPRSSPDRILVYVSAGRDHAQLILDDARRSPTVRDLRLLVHRPTYVPGFELAAPGWNAAHGVYYDQPPSLADVRPESDLDEIHRTLHDLTVDFPWKDAASKINFYGLLLTPMLRTAIPSSNVPLHLVVAALPRTGKTLLITEVVGGIHLGRSLPVTTWSGDEAEREKRALAILLRGGEFLLLDNLKDLDSPTLAALITSRTFEGRMLGRSAMVCAPNHVTIAATANNPRLSAEIAKRSIPIALQPDTDEPEARTDFNHPDLPEYIASVRPRVLSALLGLVESWKQAGQPEHKRPMGGFDQWARVVGGILDHAGLTSWRSNARDWARQADPDGSDLREFVAEWWSQHGSDTVTASTLLQLAREQGVFPTVFAAKSEAGARVAFSKRVLVRHIDAPVGAHMIRRRGSGSTSLYYLEERSI